MSTELNKNRGLLEAAIEIEDRRRNTLVLARLASKEKDYEKVDQLLAELVPDEALLGLKTTQRDPKLRIVRPKSTR